MKRILVLLWILAVGCYAAENIPMTPKIDEGKSVYISASPPVDMVKEGNIQKEDQNITKLGGAKWDK